MNALLFGATLLAQIITSQPPALTTEQALEKFNKTCTGGKKSPECDQLRWQLEFALYEDLVFLSRTTGKLDDAMLRVGAAADVPQLKAFCLKAIRSRGVKPEEHPLVIAALNDPYPIVRWAAEEMVGQLPEKHARMLSRDPSSSGPSTGVAGLIGGTLPDAKRLGAAPYPGATYWYFASDRESDFFTTPDSPEKVVANYAKGGKKAITAAELKSKIEAAKKAPEKDPMAMSRMMQEAMAKGEDPMKMMERMTKGGDTNLSDWTRDVEGEDGVVNPRYVILTENQFFGMPVPASVVIVFKDEIMGATSIVFRRLKPQMSLGPMTTKQEVDAMTKRNEVLGTPDAQVPSR